MLTYSQKSMRTPRRCRKDWLKVFLVLELYEVRYEVHTPKYILRECMKYSMEYVPKRKHRRISAVGDKSDGREEVVKSRHIELRWIGFPPEKMLRRMLKGISCPRHTFLVCTLTSLVDISCAVSYIPEGFIQYVDTY